MLDSLPTVGLLATLAGREDMLERVIGDILPQVDRLLVLLNGHQSVPDFLVHPKVSCSRGPNRGISAKFSMAEDLQAVFVSIDDDIQYPSNYVERLRDGLRTWGEQCIVGFHSSTLAQADDWLQPQSMDTVAYWVEQREDRVCNVLGTGTIAWSSAGITIGHDDLPFPVGLDLQIAVLGQRRGLRFVSLSRPAHWMTSLWPPDERGIRRAGSISIWQHTLQDTDSPLNARPAKQWAATQVSTWQVH